MTRLLCMRLSATLGGALIGLSAALLWRNNGRIAGISGIVGGLLTPRATDVVRRAAFILGLIAAPVFYGFAGGALPKIEVTSPCW